MTKQIRKEAPVGAQYFRLIGSYATYYKYDEFGRVYCWDANGFWSLIKYARPEDLEDDSNIHALDSENVTAYLLIAFVGALFLLFVTGVL